MLKLNQMDLTMLPMPPFKRLRRLGLSEAQWDALLYLAHAGAGGLPLARGTSRLGIDGRTARCLAARPRPVLFVVEIDVEVTQRDWSLVTSPRVARATISPRGEKLLAAEASRARKAARR